MAFYIRPTGTQISRGFKVHNVITCESKVQVVVSLGRHRASLSFVRPRASLSFDQWHATRSPPIRKRIWVGRYNKTQYPQQGLEPRPFDPETSALTTRPPFISGTWALAILQEYLVWLCQLAMTTKVFPLLYRSWALGGTNISCCVLHTRPKALCRRRNLKCTITCWNKQRKKLGTVFLSRKHQHSVHTRTLPHCLHWSSKYQHKTGYDGIILNKWFDRKSHYIM